MVLLLLLQLVVKSIINFSVGFDAMGLTDNANPIGLMPFLNPGLGILGWDIFHTYLIEFQNLFMQKPFFLNCTLGKKRKRRDLPDPENIQPHEIAGGER